MSRPLSYNVYNRDTWPFFKKPFDFYKAASATDVLKALGRSPSSAGVFCLMEFVATTLQSKLPVVSPYSLLPVMFIDVTDSNAIFDYNMFDKLYVGDFARNDFLVLPIALFAMSIMTEGMTFLWINKPMGTLEYFCPLSDAENLIPYVTRSINSKLSFGKLETSFSLMERINIRSNGIVTLIPFKLITDHMSSLWCIYMLVRKMGPYTWTELNEEYLNPETHDVMLRQFNAVVRATVRLMAGCIRSVALDTYVEMFEDKSGFNIDYKFFKDLQQQVFGNCSFHTPRAREQFEVIRGATEGEDVASRKMEVTLGTKSTLLFKNIIERNNLRDPETRQLFKNFIPRKPSEAALPVFRV
jgi:hypothetical protein